MRIEASRRTQNFILTSVSVLAVGTSSFAVWSVGRPHPSISTTVDGQRTESPSSAPGETEPAMVDTPDTTARPPSADVPIAASSHSESPSVESWLQGWSGQDADLLVVGDGNGNLPSHWIQHWGNLVATDRPVTIRHWGEAADVRFNEPIVLSASEGPDLTIWSASRAGTTVADASARYDRFREAGTDADAVLISLGLGSERENVGQAMDELMEEIGDDVPVLLLVGPTGSMEAEVGEELAVWADANTDQVVTVDLRKVSLSRATAQEWARAFARILEGE